MRIIKYNEFTKIPEMFDNPVYLEPTFTLNGIPI